MDINTLTPKELKANLQAEQNARLKAEKERDELKVNQSTSFDAEKAEFEKTIASQKDEISTLKQQNEANKHTIDAKNQEINDLKASQGDKTELEALQAKNATLEAENASLKENEAKLKAELPLRIAVSGKSFHPNPELSETVLEAKLNAFKSSHDLDFVKNDAGKTVLMATQKGVEGAKAEDAGVLFNAFVKDAVVSKVQGGFGAVPAQKVSNDAIDWKMKNSENPMEQEMYKEKEARLNAVFFKKNPSKLQGDVAHKKFMQEHNMIKPD